MRAVVGAGLMVTGLLAAAAAAQAPDCVVIDDFAKATVGQFPAEWKPRKDEGRDVYSVQEEGSVRFLRATARGLGIQAGRAHEWDLQESPVVAWSCVYVMVPYSKVRGPKAVKYIRSERVPAGERLNSNAGLTQVRVLRSGRDSASEWREERVNVRDDYLRFFNESSAPRTAGIAVLTDADDTKSVAVGDYANFRACRG
jgi:hypothetical protein